MKSENYLSTEQKHHREIYEIAASMIQAGLPPKFVQRAQNLAIEYEGAYDLMVLWHEESETEERGKIIADLEEHIDDKRDNNHGKILIRPKIDFDDIKDIAENTIAFKAKLRTIVDSNGGVPELSKRTGMAEPSLYRFFSSASIPRKTTLYKIANALGLEEKDIVNDYIR